jgi:HlyD family secretion protein
MSCNADIETETVKDVISVPIQSVTARTDIPETEDTTKVEKKKGIETSMPKFNKPKEVVFLANNGKAKIVVVETGIRDDNYLEIKNGLSVDDEVISGSYRAIFKELEDGSIVELKKEWK